MKNLSNAARAGLNPRPGPQGSVRINSFNPPQTIWTPMASSTNRILIPVPPVAKRETEKPGHSAFQRSLVRRGERTSREVLADIMAAAWKLFTVLFKIWITVTLVVYFVLFVVIVIGGSK